MKGVHSLYSPEQRNTDKGYRFTSMVSGVVTGHHHGGVGFLIEHLVFYVTHLGLFYELPHSVKGLQANLM